MTFYRNRADSRVIELRHSSMPADEWEPVSQAHGKALQRDQCRAELREMLQPGAHVYCVIRSVSRSGMQRRISLFCISGDSLVCIDWAASRAMDDRQHADGGIIVHGCGMDMCFHLVYCLGRVLYPEGFGILGKRANGRPVRPMSAAHAARLVKSGAVLRGRNGDASGWDSDGGYALKHVTI